MEREEGDTAWENVDKQRRITSISDLCIGGQKINQHLFDLGSSIAVVAEKLA